jgi:hypothetical protein
VILTSKQTMEQSNEVQKESKSKEDRKKSQGAPIGKR